MSNLYIYPYNSNSESAKLLAERLGAKRIKLQNSEYVHKEDNFILNWGNSNCPYTSRVLNPGSAIKNTVDKLDFFRKMVANGFSQHIPTYYTNPADIPICDFPVLCRTSTTGMDGAGIVVARNRDELVAAPLYTKYIGNSTEYRVTIFKGEVTDIQTKLPRAGESFDPIIKTYANGWGFQRLPVPPHIRDKIVEVAKIALEVAGLDFGGVDVVRSGSLGRAFVLEVNTAMGLEGQALERFAEAVERYLATTLAEAPVNTLEEPSEGPTEAIIDLVKSERWVEALVMIAKRMT